MAVFIMLLVLLVVVTVPVMIGARLVGAANTGVGSALLSVLALMVVSYVCNRFFHSALLNFLASAGIGGVVMAGILGTTFWRAIAVSLIASAIQIGVAMLFFGAVLATA
jgi:hypothetical protein